jgi:hypothetical protein
MNVVNRLAMILLILLLIVLTAVVVIVPLQSVGWSANFLQWLHQSMQDYVNSNWAFFATGRVVIGGVIALLCLLLLWLEVRRPRKKTIQAQKLAGGEAHIAVESIEQRLEYNIDQLPDVVKVTPHIKGRSRGVDVDLVLETSPDIDVPMKTEEVIEVTREVIVERLGLKLGKVQVKIKHAPYPKE